MSWPCQDIRNLSFVVIAQYKLQFPILPSPQPPSQRLMGGQVPKTSIPTPSQREGNKIFKPFLAAFAAKNGKKEGSPALERGLRGGEKQPIRP